MVIPRWCRRVVPFALTVASALLATSCSRSVEPSRVYLAVPGLRLDDWIDCDGVRERRAVDEVARRGWILRPADLSTRERRALDRLVARTGDTLRVGGTVGPERGVWVGPDEGGVHVRFEEGIEASGAEAPPDLAEECAPWIDREDHLRWEEIPEMLALTGSENLAFRNLSGGSSPMVALKQAYLRDKRAANLAIWLLGTRAPQSLDVELTLPRIFHRAVLPFLADARAALQPIPPPARTPDGLLSLTHSAPELREAAARANFAARVEASRTRVAGRCDRILQSIAGDAVRGSWCVIDCRDSSDPFVAVLRVGERLGSPAERGEGLETILARRP